MNKNIGTVDRVIRIIAALMIGILMASGALTGILGTVFGILAVASLLTGMVTVCPLYAALKLSTKKDAAHAS